MLPVALSGACGQWQLPGGRVYNADRFRVRFPVSWDFSLLGVLLMYPSRSLFDATWQAFADAANLWNKAPGAEPVCWLITEDFAISPALLLADLTRNKTDFVPTDISIKSGTQGKGVDPTNGDGVLTLLCGSDGGFFFLATNITPPVTVYGWCFVTQDDVALLCVGKFSQPIILTATDQFVLVPDVSMRIPFTILS